MEKRFENKLTMINAVMSLLNQNQVIWQGSAPFVSAVNDLKAKVLLIELAQQEVLNPVAGITGEKQSIQDSVVDKAYELASMLFALAEKTKDMVLKAKVDFPISELRNIRDGELAVSSKNILALGIRNETALADYNISAGKLNELQTLITQYETQIPGYRVTVSTKKANNEKLKGLLADAMKILTNQTDKLMIGYKVSQSDFYASYGNARKIVDYGIRHEKPETAEAQPEMP